MKRHINSTSTRAAFVRVAVQLPHQRRLPVSRPLSLAPRGFTLVELLVVITIIGILVGLAIPAVMYARVIAKQAAVTMDLKQLEMACQSYKEKFGKYPPDFAGINDPDSSIQLAARSAVLRHLAKAFPRFVVAGADDTARWTNLQTGILASWGVDISTLTPASALTFWLGGKPEWIDSSNPNQGIRGFSGFSANPTNPFDNNSSRIKPFYDFDLKRMNYLPSYGLVYWPQGAEGNKSTAAIVYFRAENSNYTVDGNSVNLSPNNVKNIDYNLWPAIDTRLSNIDGLYTFDSSLPYPVYSWINPRSFQIFSSGLDVTYSSPITISPGGLDVCLAFPTGENYNPVGNTYDDITNFSDGTLENAMP